MDQGLRVRERLGLADLVTLANGGIGVVAAVVAFTDPVLAARLLLLAAILDAVDGIVARKVGNTEVGPLLDSVTDVVSFGGALGIFLYSAMAAAWGWLGTGPFDAPPLEAGVAVAGAWVVVVFSVTRTALYTVFVAEGEKRPGIQNTLAATILAAAYLAGLTTPAGLLAVALALSVAMVAPVPYPKLMARDAIVLGAVQAAAILAPTLFGRVFPRALLLAALAYMFLAPRYYWGDRAQ